MRTAVPEKILKIIDDIDREGNASLTRLTVLKKWFEEPRRLQAFGLWVARRAAGRKGKTTGAAGALLDEARALLGTASTAGSVHEQVAPEVGRSLQERARDFQNTYENRKYVRLRVIECWALYLVECGLALHLGGAAWGPTEGYKLAADWAKHFDSRCGDGFNGPSRGKLHELVRWMFCVEAVEGE